MKALLTLYGRDDDGRVVLSQQEIDMIKTADGQWTNDHELCFKGLPAGAYTHVSIQMGTYFEMIDLPGPATTSGPGLSLLDALLIPPEELKFKE